MRKPLAQALVMIAAAAVASDEPSGGRRLAARRGRRRPVKRETESSHGLKESTPQLGKRAAPDGKTRFMLLSTQRSGTHYVMHELRIRCSTSSTESRSASPRGASGSGPSGHWAWAASIARSC